MARTYTKAKRAEKEAETRLRIVEATVDLHREVGPARTTIKMIAERAGVQRHTVYAHFPDEAAIFRACTAHWLAANPMPDHERWAAIEAFGDRVRAALEDVSAYWERTADDLIPVMADAGRVPAMEDAREFWAERTDAWVDAVCGDLRPRGRRRTRLRTALRHALALETWRSLTAPGGMSRREAVRLMADLVGLAAEPDRR